MVINQQTTNKPDFGQDFEWVLTTIDIEDSHIVHDLQNELFSYGLPSMYERKNPHITLLPPIRCSNKTRSQLYDRLNTSPIKGATIQINGAGVWPNISNPRVILLDVSFDENIKQFQNKLLAELNPRDIRYSPSPFHITIAKTCQSQISSSTIQHTVQKFISNNRETWHTRSSEYNIKNVV